MGRYIRPEVTSSRRGGVRERVTLVAGQYRGEEWQLEEPIQVQSTGSLCRKGLVQFSAVQRSAMH